MFCTITAQTFSASAGVVLITTSTVEAAFDARHSADTRVFANTSQTFNLASTRVFTFNGAGTQTFRFRVRPLRIDSGANCYIYNAAFSVVFIP